MLCVLMVQCSACANEGSLLTYLLTHLLPGTSYRPYAFLLAKPTKNFFPIFCRWTSNKYIPIHDHTRRIESYLPTCRNRSVRGGILSCSRGSCRCGTARSAVPRRARRTWWHRLGRASTAGRTPSASQTMRSPAPSSSSPEPSPLLSKHDRRQHETHATSTTNKR